MHVISRKKLREFWESPRGRGAEGPLKAWFREVMRADWATPADIKRSYRSADFVGRDRVVFNIGGNKFRLVVAVKFSSRIVFIKWLGTHADYDAIDVEEVEHE